MGDFGPAQESFERIQNRHGLELFVKIIEPPNVRGNAYLVHGLTDVHDTPHMRALTSAFTQRGYRVVVWDSSHSWGRSEGSSDRATFYFHHEDLEDVIAWSSGQTWYAEPFMMAGFSLGGVAAGTFAASHPRQVEGLALVSSVVSGARVRRRIPAPFRGLWRLRKVMTVPPGDAGADRGRRQGLRDAPACASAAAPGDRRQRATASSARCAAWL
jgi:pimeloyl-ACP methyl ester carboxylesterase